jgi:hypothetical protein
VITAVGLLPDGPDHVRQVGRAVHQAPELVIGARPGTAGAHPTVDDCREVLVRQAQSFDVLEHRGVLAGAEPEAVVDLGETGAGGDGLAELIVGPGALTWHASTVVDDMFDGRY